MNLSFLLYIILPSNHLKIQNLDRQQLSRDSHALWYRRHTTNSVQYYIPLLGRGIMILQDSDDIFGVIRVNLYNFTIWATVTETPWEKASCTACAPAWAATLRNSNVPAECSDSAEKVTGMTSPLGRVTFLVSVVFIKAPLCTSIYNDFRKKTTAENEITQRERMKIPEYPHWV